MTGGNALAEPQEVRMLVRTVVEESGVAQAQLARDAGISYEAIRSWVLGRRAPTPESVQQLAAGLRRRAARLQNLAAQLEGKIAES